MDQNVEEFYTRLKQELENTTDKWPLEYLYKFIVPADENNVKIIENAFNGMGAVLTSNQSKTGKFTSISVNVLMPNSDIIIQKYQELSVIEGIISL